MKLAPVVKTIGNFVERNSPQILTGLGVAGLVSTAIMTGRSAIKAHDTIRENERLLASSNDPDILSVLDELHERPWITKVKWTWKYYIPPVLMGATSIACIIGAQSVNTKRNAAIASLYSLTKSTLEDYQEKVREHLGENKEEKIRSEVAQKRLDDNPISSSEVVFTGIGDHLVYDSYSGRYFKSDIEKIRRVVNDLNHDLMGVMWVPLNDLYCALGIPVVKMGDELGWTVDELIDVKFSSRITENGEPCLVMDYDLTPRYLKGSFYGGL